MPGQQRTNRVQPEREQRNNNVVHIYQVRPEMALEHLRRTTGLEFDPMPENLVNDAAAELGGSSEAEPPLLTDIVDYG